MLPYILTFSLHFHYHILTGCACGGGHRHFGHDFEAASTERRLQARRRLQESDSAANAETAAASVLPNGELAIDFTTRSGAGSSPGITNVSKIPSTFSVIASTPTHCFYLCYPLKVGVFGFGLRFNPR